MKMYTFIIHTSIHASKPNTLPPKLPHHPHHPPALAIFPYDVGSILILIFVARVKPLLSTLAKLRN